jgi:hypothetical protein
VKLEAFLASIILAYWIRSDCGIETRDGGGILVCDCKPALKAIYSASDNILSYTRDNHDLVNCARDILQHTKVLVKLRNWSCLM